MSPASLKSTAGFTFPQHTCESYAIDFQAKVTCSCEGSLAKHIFYRGLTLNTFHVKGPVRLHASTKAKHGMQLLIFK